MILVYLFVWRCAKAMSLYIVLILNVNVLSACFKNKRGMLCMHVLIIRLNVKIFL